MQKPILITRGIIIFPNNKLSIDVGRTKSVLAIKSAINDDKKIIIVSQHDPLKEEPSNKEIYQTGTICQINDIKENKENDTSTSYTVSLKAIERVKVLRFPDENELECEYEILKYDQIDIHDIPELERSILQKNNFNINASTFKKITTQLINDHDVYKALDAIAFNCDELKIDQKQQFLEINNAKEKIEFLRKLIIPEYVKSMIDGEINNKLNSSMHKQQKEFYLREKLRIMKEELGEISSKDKLASELKKRVEENPYPERIKKVIIDEIRRIELSANPQENSVSRTYVEWLLDLPWWQKTEDNKDFKKVQRILDKTHYGLEKVKERIIEYLALKTKSPDSKAPIICLVGPPGVGKSTLAYSIAEALDKKFVKMSLGGVRDESEIRGHRKTYVAAMPGRVIKAMKQAGVINPLFLLDEVDKMTSDMRGDPASALLEVLDISQNHKFSDNYIEEDYDLSKVMFVATANYAEQIPEALYDRLEIIELTSYTEREKLEIAKKHLIPKILLDAKLSTKELSFTDDALLFIIRHYTRESGVRELERLIQKIARKVIVQQLANSQFVENINSDEKVINYLKKILYEYNKKEAKTIPGVVNGMAYTSAGGDLLPIEVTLFKGKGNIVITGNLKETMKESANVALGYVKANAEKFGIQNFDFNENDIHIHVPSGGIPKDGPSAGVTLTTAIISALTKKVVKNTISMTGEITLRGRVLIIGGVKEKVISAFRSGVNEIFMPKDDERYLDDVPVEVREKIKFHLVEHYDEIYQEIFK